MSKIIFTLCSCFLLSACTTLKPGPSDAESVTHAVVTSVSTGRASVPDEMSYGLRTPGGRVYFVTQRMKRPPKEGDAVEIELGRSGTARIREN